MRLIQLAAPEKAQKSTKNPQLCPLFQPWAAQTGQQILEAIDEPRSQRLEQPYHCPREHYNVMLQTWRHEPHHRPTFEHLLSILEDAKPEQVQAVVSASSAHNGSIAGKEGLEFEVGDVITVLDKPENSDLWSGAMSNGRIGLFAPGHTVAYVGTMPSQGNHSRWQNEDLYHSTNT